MKTARFADVVEASGRPDLHILLTRPEDDKAIQTAVRSHRVMTIQQDPLGGKADRGTVGFDPGPSRQFLIFPRSLSQFAGRFILAINYELLKAADAQPPIKHPAKKSSDNSSREARHAKPPPTKIIPFMEPASPSRQEGHRETAPKEGDKERPKDPSEELEEAIGLLKQGKRAPALKLLQKLARRLRVNPG